MKKKYEKPRAFVEKFELSQHIAACAWDMNASKPEECTATADTTFGYPEDLVIFVNADICGGSTSLENYCITNSDSDWTLFNS